MCTRPLKGFKHGFTPLGHDRYIICSYNVDHLEIVGGNIHKVREMFRVYPDAEIVRDPIDIPCGSCMECLLDRSRKWANRCLLEAKQYEHNCFITLTYDDISVPTVTSIRSDTGEEVEFKTLVKADLQKFIKRLRKELDKYQVKIRYFACGEYGPQTARPHYHLLIFGWSPGSTGSLEDIIEPNKVVAESGLGYTYYESSIISKAWSDPDSHVPLGHHVVSDLTWETCAYVSRYTTKKIGKYDKKIYEKNGIQPEFLVMSRCPGIGREWIDSHKQCYATFSDNYISTEYGSRPIGHNRYFDNVLDEDIREDLKEKRLRIAKNYKKIMLDNSDLSYEQIMENKDDQVKKRTLALQRKEI